MRIINNHTAHADSKNRIMLYQSLKDVSDKALKVMDTSIANFEKGKVSVPIDLSDIPQ